MQGQGNRNLSAILANLIGFSHFMVKQERYKLAEHKKFYLRKINLQSDGQALAIKKLCI